MSSIGSTSISWTAIAGFVRDAVAPVVNYYRRKGPLVRVIRVKQRKMVMRVQNGD